MKAQRTSLVSFIGIALLLTISCLTAPQISVAATAGEIDRDVDRALNNLYRITPVAQKIAKISKGVLVFPKIVKGGIVIGGQYGEGAFRVGGKTTGYFKTVAASYGLQVGVQSFGYALFFIDNDSLHYLNRSQGWEIGVGPSIVIVDEGVARSLTTTTVKSGVYAFIFQQKGLMAGIGIQGSKISRISPDK